jgi:putative ABC transport system permease protein
MALGAGRGRIVRLVLAEASIVSAAASVAAVAVAYGGLWALQPLLARLPRADEISIDGRALACALVLGAAASLLAGLLPALRSAGVSRAAGMRGRVSARPQTMLIAAEVALAFVLVMGAGLMIRTFIAIRSHDLGYDPRGVLTNFVALPPSPDGSRTAGAAMFARIRERVAALPGVRAVATASALPMFGVQISMDVHPQGEPERRREHLASLTVISDDYFRVMGISRRGGRMFGPQDRDGGPRVAMVSESVARRYFGGAPLGRRIILPEFLFNVDGGKDVAPEIVGVAGNICVDSVKDCDAEIIYLPESQNALRMENLVVRTDGNPMALAKAVRHAVFLEAPMVPLDDPLTLADRTAYLSDAPKRAMWLLGVFAGLALVLAAVGIYGVSAYLAVQRSREIGIRMALGARFEDIARLVFRGTLAPAAAGLAAGAAASVWLTRLLDALLTGVHPGDPRTAITAAVTLLAAAILAAAGPALRAARIDPARVLRRE